jgi:hypothetical protein
LTAKKRPGPVSQTGDMARIARVVAPGIPHRITQRGTGGIPGGWTPGRPGSFAAREGPPPGADQEMRMVREEGPGIHRPGPLLRQRGQARDEVRPVGVVPEERGPLDPPHHHVVQGVRRIEPRRAGHSTAASTTRRQKMQRITGSANLSSAPLVEALSWSCSAKPRLRCHKSPCKLFCLSGRRS